LHKNFFVIYILICQVSGIPTHEVWTENNYEKLYSAKATRDIRFDNCDFICAYLCFFLFEKSIAGNFGNNPAG